MGAKTDPKMEPNDVLGRSWDRLGRFWRGLGGDRFSMIFRSAKSPPKIAKEATNGGPGDSGWYFWVGPAECAVPVGRDLGRGSKNLAKDFRNEEKKRTNRDQAWESSTPCTPLARI